MRRFQCKQCDLWNEDRSEDHGKLVARDHSTAMLHGQGQTILPVSVYTIECSKCGRSWIFRRRRKK